MEIWLQILVQWSHSWRMTVFFFISGFFALMVFRGKGAAHLVRDRILRLGLTLILFASLYDMLDGRFDGILMHIWFIYYLLIFSLIASLFWKMTSSSSPEDEASGSHKMLIGLLIAFVPVRMVCDLLDGGTIGIPVWYGDIKPGGFLHFAFCFLTGAALFTGRHVLDKLARKPVMLAIGAVALVSFAIAFSYVDGVFGHRRTPGASVADAVTGSAFAAISALSWSILLLAVTHALVKRGNALVRWFVELSYPVYLVHFLPVMLVGAMLIGKGYSQPIVVVGTVILTFLISVVAYYVLIKFTPLSWIVNGYHKSWLKLPSAGKSAGKSG
jgi:glucan biosynthesis protein C